MTHQIRYVRSKWVIDGRLPEITSYLFVNVDELALEVDLCPVWFSSYLAVYLYASGLVCVCVYTCGGKVHMLFFELSMNCTGYLQYKLSIIKTNKSTKYKRAA